MEGAYVLHNRLGSGGLLALHRRAFTGALGQRLFPGDVAVVGAGSAAASVIAVSELQVIACHRVPPAWDHRTTAAAPDLPPHVAWSWVISAGLAPSGRGAGVALDEVLVQ